MSVAILILFLFGLAMLAENGSLTWFFGVSSALVAITILIVQTVNLIT